MGVTPNYNLATQDILTIDKNSSIKNSWDSQFGNNPNSNMYKIDTILKEQSNIITELQVSTGFKEVSASLTSSSSSLDTYSATIEDISEYQNKMVVLLMVDISNVNNSCLKINNLGFLYLRKNNMVDGEYENLSVDDLKLNTKYFYQIILADEEVEGDVDKLVLLGECANNYIQKDGDKVLSDNNFSDEEQTKLENVPAVNTILTTTSNISDTVNTFTQAETRTNLITGEKISISLGKIKKWFTDLKTVAFTGSYNDLNNKPTSLPADGGNADTVGGFTVDINVPDDAVFTDTIVQIERL